MPAAGMPASVQSQYVEAGHLLDERSRQLLAEQCILIENDLIIRAEPCGHALKGARILDWSASTVLLGSIGLHNYLTDAGQDADVVLPLKTSPQLTALIGARKC
ncbi:hypothetical protein [Altererythrobacter sp. MF3-039]|uniref:hypothetical protein n=1 Tax=Altererythrobacter sp. MF3-039 TaxID=3252901 RepID=UPI00390CB14C